jgi:hypothetical protein
LHLTTCCTILVLAPLKKGARRPEDGPVASPGDRFGSLSSGEPVLRCVSRVCTLQ